ncbi:MAG TPA: hypothetical protein VFR87_17140, partial [Nocardioidaceae bacterium]|nr:hypothetical protein [Nocardioidaceae bacterium]
AVRASARRLQHRRRVVTGVVAAAVTSIALPTGVAVTGALDDNGNGDGGYVAGPSASASPTDASTATALAPPGEPVPLTLQGLPRGRQTTVRYIVGDQQLLVTAEGDVDLGTSYTQLTPYRDGWLGLAGTENGWENVVLDEDMTVQRSTLGGDGIMPNTEGTRVLYVQRELNVPGRTVVVDEPSRTTYEREQMTWDVPDGTSAVLPLGYLDDDTVVFQVTTAEGMTAPYLASAGDADLVPVDRFLRLTSASEANGLVAGMVTYNPAKGSCWGVMDPARSTTDLVWRTCEYSLHEFSPDGRYVIASAPDSDGMGPAGLVVLDVETWKPVVEFEPERRTLTALTQATWEDADTVAAVLMEGNEYALVRAELDGRLEAVSDTYESRDMSLPLWLAERPRL